ncbi:MAG: metal ABC transporter permease, partial [Bacteroidota bacterium]
MSDILTILIASLIGISCSILGCFLVLRKMALLTDAISHAVLPGIVIAFLLSQSRDTFFMVLGAGTFGFFTSFLVEWLQKKGRIQADASIGIVFTFFFAVGIILVTQYTQKIDLDQECVLYGDLLHVTLDVWRLADGTNVGPKTLWLLTPILLVIIMFVTIFYRTLQIITFDIIFAQSIGIPIALFHYTLTALVSFTTVTSFESVGAILVVAFFIIPPATAQLLTKCLRHMIILSA